MINYVRRPALKPGGDAFQSSWPSDEPIQGLLGIGRTVGRGSESLKRRPSNILTLQRSDYKTRPVYVGHGPTKMRYATAPDLAQAVAGYLGIPLTNCRQHQPATLPVGLMAKRPPRLIRWRHK